MLGCTRSGVGTWTPFPSAQICGLTLSHCTAWSHSASPLLHLLHQTGHCWGLWSEGKCQLQDPAFCMQNQGGKGETGQEKPCGEWAVSLHINCTLLLRTSSLHCLRYDTKERYFNLRSSLSEGTNLGSWCSEEHGQMCQLGMRLKCLKWGFWLLSSGKLEIRCPREVSRFYIHFLGSQAIKVR